MKMPQQCLELLKGDDCSFKDFERALSVLGWEIERLKPIKPLTLLRDAVLRWATYRATSFSVFSKSASIIGTA